MKILQSTTENVWVEIKKIELTLEEKELQRSTSENDKEAKRILITRIKNEREAIAEEDDIILAQNAYDSIKPELEENQTYRLISSHFVINNNNVTSGIINCRINDNHIQRRL